MVSMDKPKYKRCARCKRNRGIKNFQSFPRNRSGLASYCRDCMRDAWNEWNVAHPGVKRERSKVSVAKAKMEAFTAYGAKCACCGEVEPMFLTIDHVNNDGGGRKRSGSIYFVARREGFPSRYQVLCYNCNLGKARNGGKCPHQT